MYTLNSWKFTMYTVLKLYNQILLCSFYPVLIKGRETRGEKGIEMRRKREDDK